MKKTHDCPTTPGAFDTTFNDGSEVLVGDAFLTNSPYA